MMYSRTFLNAVTGLVWHDGENSCVLKDDGRYFGHAVKSGFWRAYGLTAPGTAGNELAYLGRYQSREEAKASLAKAVAALIRTSDQPIAVEGPPKTRTASYSAM